MDGLEVLCRDGVGLDAFVGVEMTGDVSNQVFHEFWIIVGFFRDMLLIGSLEDAVQLTTRFFLNDFNDLRIAILVDKPCSVW